MVAQKPKTVFPRRKIRIISGAKGKEKLSKLRAESFHLIWQNGAN